jgi:predicted enzyme involved in methoxymalonyl-ACP biosynthesis
VVNTFIPPLYPELGIALAPDRSDVASQVADLNRFIVDFVRKRAPRFRLTYWNRYLGLLGAEAALDDRGRYLWKAPFRKAFLDLYAQDLARVVRALQGKAKKCLVLDCDNTLWGGIVGEDGLDGIKLDRNSYPGKAFYDFQTSILHLAERGVLIVICSKNNEADVFEVLDKHPWCRLKTLPPFGLAHQLAG